MFNRISLAIILFIINFLAALSDLRSFRVSNTLIQTGAVLGLSLHLLMYGGRGLADAFLGLFVPLALLPLFMFSMIGAGDIKLFMVTGIFLGPGLCLQSMALTGILAAFWSLLRLIGERLTGERFAYLYSYLTRLLRLKSAGSRILVRCPSYIGQAELEAGRRWLIPLAVPLCLADLIICLMQLMSAS